MVSRYYLQEPDPKPGSRRKSTRPSDSGRRGYLSGWLILLLITIAYVAWRIYRWNIQPPWLSNLPTALFDVISLVEMAAAITIVFLWAALIWQSYTVRRRAARSLTLTKEQLQELDPKGFEHYVAELFQKKGYQVTIRGGTGDHGVDLELSGANGKRAIVQCKRYRDTVGEKVVRDLFGTLLHERASRAFLVTTADISSAAMNWSQGKPITLIDGDMLVAIASVLNDQIG